MTRPSRLDDPEYSGFAWARYWRLMRWMLAFTLIVTVAALFAFWWNNGFVSIHFLHRYRRRHHRLDHADRGADGAGVPVERIGA